MTPENEHPTERALSFARLPDRLDGRRVLELGGIAGGRAYLEGLGASDFLALDGPSEDADLEEAGFDLVVCGSDLATDAHPLALYAWLRRAIKPDGILVAGSSVLPDPKRSQYAHFVPAAEPGGTRRWVPGRLAFRWMVEVSGFDLVAWLGDGADGGSENRVYLQAKAVDRRPALDLERQPLGR